jgi:kynurenine formamidase
MRRATSSPAAGSSPRLSPDELFAPAVVVDISQRAANDADAAVEVRDLRRLERRHGRIPHGALVFMPTPSSGCWSGGTSAASASTR